MQISGVATVVLVEDLDRAIKFYRDKIGLRLHQEQEDWAFFEEGVGLMVSPEPLPEDSFRINAVLLSLSVADAHAAYHELIDKGVAFFVGPTDVGGAIVASFRDSEGNLVQLMQSNLS